MIARKSEKHLHHLHRLVHSHCDSSFRSSWSQGEFEKYLKSLFEQQEDLYQAGARNFLFLDVPPIDKAPACEQRIAETT